MRKNRNWTGGFWRLFTAFLLVGLLAGCSGGQTETADAAETDAETASEKITLTLGCYKDKNWPAIREFNLSQDKYVIETVDYSNNRALSKDERE